MAAVLNKTTKQYLESVNTPDYLDGNWLINPDLSAVLGTPLQYWVIDGDTVREATESEQADIDALAGFDGTSIVQAKSIMYGRINDYRDSLTASGVVMKSTKFDTDDQARQNIAGICNAISLGYHVPSNFTWRDHYNNNIPFTNTDCTTLGIGLMGYVATVFATSWYHKDTLKAMVTTSVSDIANYDYTVGWPSNSLDTTTDANAGTVVEENSSHTAPDA